jgi:hypothetical protein
MTTSEDPPINPAAAGVPDPLLAPQVTATQADTLTAAVTELRRAVNRRTTAFLSILAVDVLLTGAITVLGYRSEHFLTCQVQQNAEFRAAAATERTAQRALFDIVLNPASTPADRLKASQAYYAGLIAADQQRTDAGGAC